MNFNWKIIPQERGSIGKGSTTYSTFTHSLNDEVLHFGNEEHECMGRGDP